MCGPYNNKALIYLYFSSKPEKVVESVDTKSNSSGVARNLMGDDFIELALRNPYKRQYKPTSVGKVPPGARTPTVIRVHPQV